jgi:hypothetical protein
MPEKRMDLTFTQEAMLQEIDGAAQFIGSVVAKAADTPGVDERWLAIAKTQLQQGFMALRRAVTTPSGF